MAVQNLILKNSIFLYVRMLISMFVSLYTSRVVINTLGVENYGIYAVVAGVIGLFTFLEASMSGTSSRFITYSIGTGNLKEASLVFSTTKIIHIGLAFVILFLSETIGLFIFYNKLQIPPDRMHQAELVYHMSAISMFISVLKIPYSSLVMAYEKMNVYAYIELLSVFLKLGIVYVLLFVNIDKLVLYSLLTLSVSLIIFTVYFYYCNKRLHCNVNLSGFTVEKRHLYAMLKFSGWDLYGNVCVGSRRQGYVILINMFFGPILNTASNIATTVEGTLSSFAWNIVLAVQPQIIKSYAQKNIRFFNRLIILASSLAIIAFAYLSIPILINIEFILRLWIGDVLPTKTPIFTVYCILAGGMGVLSTFLSSAINAVGNNKYKNLFTGSLSLINICIVYLFLKLGYNAEFVFFLYLIFSVLIFISNMIILRYHITEFKMFKYVKKVSLAVVFSFIIFFIVYFIDMLISLRISFLLRILLSYILCTVFFSLSAYKFLLDVEDIAYVKKYIKKIRDKFLC